MFMTMLRITLKIKEYERGQGKTFHLYEHFDFILPPSPTSIKPSQNFHLSPPRR